MTRALWQSEDGVVDLSGYVPSLHDVEGGRYRRCILFRQHALCIVAANALCTHMIDDGVVYGPAKIGGIVVEVLITSLPQP